MYSNTSTFMENLASRTSATAPYARVVPVIDLMGGIAVHAKAGLRARYQPLDSPLCAGPDPFEVIAGLLRLHAFPIFYLADLDALMGRGDQRALVHALAEAHAGLKFWLDAGWPAEEGPWTPVIGTESLDTHDWILLRRRKRPWILSLDFFDGRLRGPEAALECPEDWPERVIVMNLNQVGSCAGPDWGRLARMQALAPNNDVIAAGGVRDERDLSRLHRMGIDTVLVASALHLGRLHAVLGESEGFAQNEKAP
jgi:phosphoribosylformimino-5-aminoimidazole carboxamide ribotide isomerase